MMHLIDITVRSERPRPQPGSLPPRRTARPTALMLSEESAVCRNHFGLFSGLTRDQQAYILSKGERRTVKQGGTLFEQGCLHQGVYIIESGRIRVFYHSPAGREITLAYWSPGHFVGGPDIFGGGTHLWSGVAATTSMIVFLESRLLRRLVLEIPQLALSIIEGLSFKGRCYSTMAQMLGTRSMTERLVHLLLHLMEAYGVEEEDGIVISDGFTHAELASIVGATRQWVTMNLKKLQQSGVVSIRESIITVLRPDVLAQMEH
jgi:CRP-like cAMP-binding protein